MTSDAASYTAHWPDLDRALWEAGLRPSGAIDELYTRITWRSATLGMTAESYTRWLLFLRQNGWLQSNTPPGNRLSSDRLRFYIRELQRYNRASTVLNHIKGLNRAFVVMSPALDRAQLRAVIKNLAREVEPVSKRDRIQEPAALIELGIELMASAPAEAHRSYLMRSTMFRDGLQIALLAMRPLRMRNFRSIEIGRHLVQSNAGWRLQFEASETKAHKPLDVPFPTELKSWLDLYLRVHRARLLGQFKKSDALWISCRGTQQRHSSIATAICMWTKRRFGKTITPHLFRNCAATSLAIYQPESVQIAHTILGNTYPTMRAHYNLAKSIDAASRYHAFLDGIGIQCRGKTAGVSRCKNRLRSRGQGLLG